MVMEKKREIAQKAIVEAKIAGTEGERLQGVAEQCGHGRLRHTRDNQTAFFLRGGNFKTYPAPLGDMPLKMR
jgi:hypothetical protein